ncbi:LPXTG cell wall anchor domain-containing protein [Nocardioides sp. SYSU DS0663]|uniref:LPXTG cell wall anchor domain-containing protein n=1 Tax=Nocardioides sp. SYSU DS0663 TaxID=3416445 RepID=UPI003F4BDCFC
MQALLALLIGLAVLVVVPVAPAYAAESMVVTKTADDDVLVGGGGEVRIEARNNGDVPLYNLSFRDQLPAGVTYVPGSTRPASLGEPRTVTGGGRQTVIWENVSDLPLNAVQELTFEVTTDPAVLPVGSTFANEASAYANAEARTVPDFNPDGTYQKDASVQGSSAAAATTVSAIEVEKLEPSPEHELLRGIHRHATTYTLRVTNNSAHADDDVVLVDHLPAQLEFLGCGTVDHSSSVEYDGAPRLDVSTPDIAACRAPVSVDTVTDPAGVPAGVYTRVEWNLGNLAPGDVVEVTYAAGIPQRANADAFPGTEPTPASLEQAANLDNNTGAPTRETTTEQGLTNRARVSADYTGPVAAGTSTRVSDTDELTVTAEDVAIQKSVSPGTFDQGEIATYTLELQAGEYADASDVVITDVIPNGLCPLGAAGTNYADGTPAECAGSAGTAPSLAFASVVENGDGSFTVRFDPVALAASGDLAVTYRARMRENYRADLADTVPTVTGDAYLNTVGLTATTTTLAAVDAPGGVSTATVRDASEAWIESDTVVLDKRIQANTTTPYECATDPASYANASTLTDGQTTFAEGSRVCFLLSIDFPGGSETKNAILTDFLPDGLALETVEALPANDVAAVADGTGLRFELGTVDGDNRFVQPGGRFRYRLSATIKTSAVATAPDVTGNLAKLRWTNTDGTVSFLRDREDFTIAPPPPVVVDKTDDDSDNVVRAGDVVTYTVTLRNAGDRDVVGPDTWDRLPVGVECADVVGGSVTGGGVCTDPGDASHPTFAGNGSRSAIRWDLPDTERIAPGATVTFSYRVRFPSTVAADQPYRNDVDVASYASENNLGTLMTHYPAQNVDTTVTSGQVDAPRAHDDLTLRTPQVQVAKSNVTAVDDADQGADPAGRNYVAVGEGITYTVTATLPANTTVYDGVVRDAAPSGVRFDSVSYEFSLDNGATWAGTAPAGWTASSSSARVETGGIHVVDATSDLVRMTIEATAIGTSTDPAHGALLTNIAHASSSSEAGTTPTDRRATSSVTAVHPNPTLTKTVSDENPVAGQTVTYTLTASNPATRPTLFDAAVVDCVPGELTVVPGSLPAGVTITTPATSCAAGQTQLDWAVGDLTDDEPWPSIAYDATVSPRAAGGASYTNTATLAGTSMDGVDADEAEYDDGADATVTVPGSTLTKSVTPDRAPVGAEATYDVDVVLPADVNFYDATLVDELPVGIDLASVDRTGFTCTYVGSADACASPGSVTDLAPVGRLHGWFLGDVVADSRERLVTITYTADVEDVPTSTAGTPLTNTARLRWNTVDGAGTPAVDASFGQSTSPGAATVTVVEPSLSIAKSVSEGRPVPGETFTYTVEVTNASGAIASTAHDVDVVDTLPEGVQAVGSPSAGGVVGTGDPATITWSDLGPIAPGASVRLTYTARLATPAPTAPQVNTADVTAYTSLDGGGRTYDGPSDTASVTAGLPDIEVVKTTADPVSYVGEPTRWEIAVTNTGPATAYDVDAEDVLPEHWTYDAGTARVSVAGAPATAVEPTVDGATRTLGWADLGDLAQGESLTIAFTATPGAGVVPGTIGSAVPHVNGASATARDLEEGGSVVTDDADDATTRIDRADLTLDKAAVGTPVAGTDHSWTLTVGNDGPDTAVGPFEVTDTLPTQVTGATATGAGWSCSPAAGTVTCERTDATDTLAAGATFPPITVTATVPADIAAAVDLVNSARVEAATHEDDPSDNEDDATSTVTVRSDMGIAKDLVGELVPGGQATYTLAVRNDGPSQARGAVVVTDTLPTGLTYASHTGAGWTLDRTGQDLAFTWSGATPVPLGAMPVITVRVDVASDLTAAVTNTGSVTEPTDPTTGPEAPDSDPASAAPVPSADLGVTKSSVGAFRAGTQGEYSFEVVNNGPSDAAGPITVTDTLPDELTYDSAASTDGWTCSATGQDVTCSLAGGLANGGTSSFTLTVDIAETLATDVVNTATVDGPTADPHAPNNTDKDDTGIDVEADLGIVKTLVTTPVVAGERVTYELAVTNHGPATSPAAIVVSDTLPTGLTFVSAAGTGWTCGATGQVVTCERGAPLASGDAADVITLVAAVGSGVGATTLTNVASVDGPATDPVPANDSDDASTVVTEDTEVSVTKTALGPDPVVAGTTTSFSVVVSNSGPSDARSVTVTDVLPAGMSLVSVAGDGWTCAAGTCSRDRVAAGGSAPALTVVARVASGTASGSTLTNRVTVATTTPGDTPAGNTDDASVGVSVAADLALVKSHPTGSAVAGSTTTYGIAVRNLGPSDAGGPITVVDTLPAGLSYLSANAPWTCAPTAGRQVSCVVATGLTAGADAPPLTLQVVVSAAAATGTVVNSAGVSSPSLDPVPANDQDTADVAVQQLADVSIVKSHVGTARVGATLEFQLRVANAGPSEARQVVVTDRLPEGLDLVSATGPGWTCQVAGDRISCTLGAALAPGAAAPVITVVAGVTPMAYPSVLNTADVRTGTPEVDLADNEDSDRVDVPALVDLVVDKSHRGRLAVGKQGVYEIVVTNRGPTAAPGPVTVTDTLPAGLAHVSSTGEGWACSLQAAAVGCALADGLDVGESSTVRIVVDVLPAAYPQVVNTAVVTSPSEEVGGGVDNGTDTDSGDVVPDVRLALEKSVVSATAGRIVYRLAVTNAGANATVAPVRLRDELPDGLRLESVRGDGWSCTTSSGRAACVHAGQIGPGETSVVRLVSRVVAAPGTSIANTATVVGGGATSGGAAAGDRADTVTVTVPTADGDSDSGSDSDGPGDGPDGSGALPGGAQDDGQDDGVLGVLPDTGGPSLWLTFAGLLLTLLGVALVVRHRRA